MKYKTEKVIGNIEQEVRNLLIAHLFDFMSQFDMKNQVFNPTFLSIRKTYRRNSKGI